MPIVQSLMHKSNVTGIGKVHYGRTLSDASMLYFADVFLCVINLGAHSAKVELCARASIRLACFAGTCQITHSHGSARVL